MLQSLLITFIIVFIIISIKYYVAKQEFNSKDFATIENKYKKLIKAEKNDTRVAVAYINLIALYINHKNYTEAKNYLNLAKKNINKFNKTTLLVLKSNEANLLIYENKISEAEALIKETIPQCNGLFNQPIKKGLNKLLIEIKQK